MTTNLIRKEKKEKEAGRESELWPESAFCGRWVNCHDAVLSAAVKSVKDRGQMDENTKSQKKMIFCCLEIEF